MSNDCICGFPSGQNVSNCERCKLIARIQYLEQHERVTEHLKESFPMLYITDQEVLAKLCRQAPDLVCFCSCHISQIDDFGPRDDGNKGDELRDRAKDDVGRVM